MAWELVALLMRASVSGREATSYDALPTDARRLKDENKSSE